MMGGYYCDVTVTDLLVRLPGPPVLGLHVRVVGVVGYSHPVSSVVLHVTSLSLDTDLTDNGLQEFFQFQNSDRLSKCVCFGCCKL